MINPEFQIGDRVICRALDYRSDDDHIAEIESIEDGDEFETPDGEKIIHSGKPTFLYILESAPSAFFSAFVLFPYQPPSTKTFQELIQNPMEFPIESTERHTETEPCNHAEFTASQTRNSTSA